MQKPVAVIAGFYDVTVMGEPVEQRRRHLRVAERARLRGEVQVGRDHHAGVLVQPAEQLEQQGFFCLTERQVPSSSRTTRSVGSKLSVTSPARRCTFSRSSALTRSTVTSRSTSITRHPVVSFSSRHQCRPIATELTRRTIQRDFAVDADFSRSSLVLQPSRLDDGLRDARFAVVADTLVEDGG